MTMITKPNAQTLLEFANLQVASEAFIVPLTSDVGTRLPENFILKNNIDKLKLGNKHATLFTQTMAKEFVGEGDNIKWKVVDHISNTKTGFSGTLFEATKDIKDAKGNIIIKAEQQVLSFRSTEFIEDAVHDNKMTNTLEIKEKGFAFGQISDMVDWVNQLQTEKGVDGKPLLDNDIKVTGYSLGAHIATAFNMLQQEGKFGSFRRVG